MSKTSDNGEFEGADLIMKPRVAYTLNNYQPVRSTIIGEQPLFYMDYEEAIEEEFDDLFGLEAIEQGLVSLEARMTSLEKDVDARTSVTANDFRTAADDLTGADYSAPASTIADLENFMARSRLAATLLNFAAENNVTLTAGTQVETARYDAKAGTIFLNMALGRGDLALCALQELRSLWQDKNGALAAPLSLHPDHAIMIHRAQIADREAVMTRFAWEMKLAGEESLWTRLLASSSNDLARALAREAHGDFRALNNGTACAAAFESWFLSDRAERADGQLIRQMMGNHRGYVFGDRDESAQQAYKILAALGTMPYGKNYLVPYVETIMDDALFTEVRDRSNANFLWFIKFEHSFQEAEQELQKGKDINSHPLSGDASRNTQNLKQSDHETSTKIIPLSFITNGETGRPLDSGARSSRGGQVIPFHSGRV